MRKKVTDKSTISIFLMQQAIDNLLLSIDARSQNKIDREIQLSINISLLLGLTIEGVINEIGEALLDTWTWEKLESVSTPLKWRIVSGLKRGFEPSQEPLQTITKLQKIRNQIAHPKLENRGKDTILISDAGVVKKNPENNYKLPDGDFSIYIGYEILRKEYNARNSIIYIRKVLKAIEEIKKLFKIKDSLEWIETINDQIKSINIDKHELD